MPESSLHIEGEPITHPPQENSAKPTKYPIGKWLAWWLGGVFHPLILIAMTIAGGFFWAYRLPSVAMVGMSYYESFCTGFVLFGLVVVGRCVLTLMQNDSTIGGKEQRRPFWIWFLAIIFATYYVIQLELPMRVAFFWSRPTFDRMADEALKDPSRAGALAGRWAGAYQIDEVQVNGKTVVFYLAKNRSRNGFARIRGVTGDFIANYPNSQTRYEEFPLSTDLLEEAAGTRITGDWFVIYSPYWRIKTGWS